MERTVPFLNGCISFVAFIMALSLVIYMLIAFVTGVFDVSLTMFSTVFLEPGERQTIFNHINAEFLHNIAILLILMKAYRILVEYMRFHHIDVKYTIEIGVIACVLELLFNSSSYSEQMQMILASLGIIFAAIYAFGYKNLSQASHDAQREMLAAREARLARKLPPPVLEEEVVTAPKPRAKKTPVRRKVAAAK